MSDNNQMRGGQDRSRVAGEQEHEVRYLAEKMGVSEDEVRRAIQQVGNDRNKVEEFLTRRNNTRD
ncbi:MAG TPA: DUF3606 domain-containing protein [Flavisolibacter sp.]|jgi:hypothetical protein|nr:DUF3606 domain-containing protein [Flavisolibacter sp.]